MSRDNVAKRGNVFSRFFHYEEKGATLTGDIIGGIVTFLAMCYILPVNSAILHDTGMNFLGVFAATAIVSAIATIIMGLVANCPVALSAGMGLNAYFSYTVCIGLGYNWQEGMILLFATGIIFFIFSLTPIRRKIIDAFPQDIKSIISAGLGAFIAFVGLKGSGIIVKSDSTYVTLGSLSSPSVLIAIGGIFLVFVLMNIKTKKGILSTLAAPIGLVTVALVGVLIYAFTGDASLPHADFTTNWGINNLNDVALFGLLSNQEGVVKGGDFWNLVGDVFSKPGSYAVIFSMIFVNMFDTSATLMAIGKDTGIIDSTGRMVSNKIIIADATGALICAPFGTSTVTSFVESTVGVKVGAKTGVASIVTGLLFLLSGIIFPVFEVFTYSCVSACALVAVGGMIFTSNLSDIHWKDPAIGFSAFISILFIVLTYSLTNGIGFGLLTYVLIRLVQKKGKEISWILYVVAALYIVSFAVNEIVAHI